MPYLISLFRGDDPQQPPAELTRSEVVATLASFEHIKEQDGNWSFNDGQVSFRICVPKEDPGADLRFEASWQTWEQLATILETAVRLADTLGTRVYDRQAKHFVDRARVSQIRANGGFAAAAPKKPGWWPWR